MKKRMELHEKLQELRKQRGLTQEELAEQLYVSRTAISKWESGRGYPSIDSLKALADFFSVTVDELLSSRQLLTVAEADQREMKRCFRERVFGSLDICTALLLFLPFFAEREGDAVRVASLFSLVSMQPYLRIVYGVLIAGAVLLGILTLVLQGLGIGFGKSLRKWCSVTLGILLTVLLTVGLQPYAAVLALALLLIKVFVLIGRE